MLPLPVSSCGCLSSGAVMSSAVPLSWTHHTGVSTCDQAIGWAGALIAGAPCHAVKDKYILAVTRDDEALTSWEERLRLAEADLEERERQALADDPTPEQLAAHAAERDAFARERDAIADRHDEAAGRRDLSALDRDVSGSSRDRRARLREQDRDVAFPDRFSAGADRDLAAGDRADSHADRRRGQEARERAAVNRDRAADDRDRAAEKAEEQEREVAGLRTALESRLVIGQAQGLLMARHKLSSETSFGVLVRLSQEHNVKVRELAAQLVAAEEAARERVAGERG